MKYTFLLSLLCINIMQYSLNGSYTSLAEYSKIEVNSLHDIASHETETYPKAVNSLNQFRKSIIQNPNLTHQRAKNSDTVGITCVENKAWHKLVVWIARGGNPFTCNNNNENTVTYCKTNHDLQKTEDAIEDGLYHYLTKKIYLMSEEQYMQFRKQYNEYKQKTDRNVNTHSKSDQSAWTVSTISHEEVKQRSEYLESRFTNILKTFLPTVEELENPKTVTPHDTPPYHSRTNSHRSDISSIQSEKNDSDKKHLSSLEWIQEPPLKQKTSTLPKYEDTPPPAYNASHLKDSTLKAPLYESQKCTKKTSPHNTNNYSQSETSAGPLTYYQAILKTGTTSPEKKAEPVENDRFEVLKSTKTRK